MTEPVPSNALVLLNKVVASLGAESPTEEMARQLVHAAQWALENVETLENAKNIRNALRRAQVQYEQRRAALSVTNLLAAERIRLEWHIGAACAEMERSNGGRPRAENISHAGNSFLVTLERVGIGRSNAYRWMSLAKINPQDLELYFEERQKQEDEISTAAVLNYFTSHVTVDPRDDASADYEDRELPEPPEMNEDLPQIRVVTIVCRHCGTKDAYEVG